MDNIKAYILADIEGSTGVFDYESTQAGPAKWQQARIEMTKDVNVAVESLFDAGVQQVVVKDFHRHGYNILPDMIDKRAILIQGYYFTPALMFGDLHDSNRAFFLGHHASSGTPDGFLAHTLTKRIGEFLVNGKRLSEVQLFAGALGQHNLPVAFYSGCPKACSEAKEHLPWIVTQEIPKDKSIEKNKELKSEFSINIRKEIEKSIRQSLQVTPKIFSMNGPFDCEVTFTDEKLLQRAHKWNCVIKDNKAFFKCDDFSELLHMAIKVAYFSPSAFKLLKYALPFARLWHSLLWNKIYIK